MFIRMDERTQRRRGRKPKGGTPTFLRLPDDLRNYLKTMRLEERRDSLSNAAVALMYAGKAAREEAKKRSAA